MGQLDAPCWKHQLTNSDALEGVIRNPIQQEEVVGRACSGSVCSLVSILAHREPILLLKTSTEGVRMNPLDVSESVDAWM